MIDIFGTAAKLFANRQKIERELALVKKMWADMQPSIKILRQEAPEVFEIGRDLVAVFAPQFQQFLAGVRPLATIKVSDLQTQLHKLSYYTDKIDNDYGPNTQAAVKAFQKDHGLEQDGWAMMGETLPAIWIAVHDADKVNHGG